MRPLKNSFPNRTASYGSVVNWTMSDCGLHGGKIALGNPDNGPLGYTNSSRIPFDTYYGTAAVTWQNNLFEDVNIYLTPSYAWYDIINVDMAVTARNNLFRGGGELVITSEPASAGHWTFTDNVFDGLELYNDPGVPLDFDHNAYWTLNSFLFSYDTGQLRMTTNGNGELHEMALSYPPAYTRGPFGNYYLDTVTPLWQGGSRTVLDAGLAQYTTFVNQLKDTSNQPVNIGLHYVATTNSQPSTINSQLPLDSDGDGVPDYVETEHGTDPNNSMTDGSTPDALNAAYDDVDLEGDGLTGRAERFLAANPIVQDNPFKLTRVITGQEPAILTYSMPLGMDVNSNQCQLILIDNGAAAGGYDFVPQTNGTYLVEWNTTFAANGFHVLQVGFDMPGYRLPKNVGGTQPVLSVAGATRTEMVTNLIQLDPDDTPFGSQMVFGGTLAVPSADYEIQIFDTNRILLKTITGHTDNGALDEVWDLTTDTNQPPRDDEEFSAQLYITPSAQNSGQYNTNLIPIWRFKKGNCADLFSFAYGWNTDGPIARLARADMIRMSVEDILFNPALDHEYVCSPLNGQGWENTSPFYMNGSTNNDLSPQQQAVVDDLSSHSVGNFYWNGHGSETSIGDGDNRSLNVGSVAISLGNSSIKRLGNLRGPKIGHAFRLVILDACKCGANPQWPQAFGITATNHSASWFQKHGESSQAMVGWTVDTDAAEGYYAIYGEGVHIADFFSAWMAGLPLIDCLLIAETPDIASFPYDRPFDPHWKIFGDPFLTHSP